MKSKSIFVIFTVLVVLAGLFGTARPVAANVTPPPDALGADLSVAVIWEKEYDWGLAKTASPTAWELFTGQSGTSQFTITATRWLAYQDSHLYVQMDVANGAAVAANNVVAQVTAVHNPSGTTGTATINFGSIPAGGSVYRYVDMPFDPALLAPGDTFSVTATVSSDNVTGGDLSASATTPSPKVANESLVVSDNGSPHTFTDSGTWVYDKTFTCGEDQQYTNTVTATVLLYGIPKPRSASATVTVDCTEYGLQVSKTARTSFDRTYRWSIDKSSSISSLTLSPGQTYTLPYSVTASVSGYTDSNFAVSGDISVTNPAPFAQTITSVDDMISGGINATVNCGVSFPYSLAGGGTLTCSYSAALPDAADRLNTATATLDGGSQYTGSAAVSFASAVMNEIDECITVSDDRFGGVLGTACRSESPKTFNYTVTVGAYGTCGQYSVNNTASFVTNDSGTIGADSWVVDITVPCGSCSLTPGYWKTHSSYGPAPYDDTWAQIGENTAFYLSGKSWYQALWTAPQGNAYYVLAHAYIAARLNQYNGADVSVISAQLVAAENFFQTYPPSASLSKAQRAEVLAWATAIDNYNNGLIGPGHCSE